MRDYLRQIRNIWKPRLSRKITVAVFLSIVAIETVILIPSVYRREQELLDRVEALSSAKAMGIYLAQPELLSDRDRLADVFRELPDLAGSTILGGVLYDADGEVVAAFGEAPGLTFDDIAPMDANQRERTSSVDRRTYRYDVVWDTEEILSPYTVIVRHDARHVRTEYISFIGWIAGLVLIISIVVTGTTLYVLDRMLIAPLLRLRWDLLVAGDIFRHNDPDRIVPEFASLSEKRDDELGDISTAFALMVDRISQGIDDLQAAQLQLVHSEKMSSLGHLVAGIAHEINNPINFIYGNIGYVNESVADLLEAIAYYQRHQNDAPDSSVNSTTPTTPTQLESATPESSTSDKAEADVPPPDLEELEFVLEDLPNVCNSMRLGAERVRDIVLSLRNFARLDEADLKRVDVREGLDNALLFLRYRLDSNGHQPSIEIQRHYAELPEIECYAGQLNQALLAILLNAIDAIEAIGVERADRMDNAPPTSDPRITIEMRQIDADRIAIAIADTGVGISPEVRPKIFDPFFTTKPVGKNKGLGLSLAERIVTVQHGGTLQVESEPGRGTEVTLMLPIRHATSAQSTPRRSQLDDALDHA